MKITLNDPDKWNNCEVSFDDNTSIPLETSLNISVPNTVRALSRDPDKYRFRSLMIDIVAPMADINTDKRVVDCIEALRDFRDGKITQDQLQLAAAEASAAVDFVYAASAAVDFVYPATYAALAAALAARVTAFATGDVEVAARVACDRVYYADRSAEAVTGAARAVGDDEYIKNLIRKYY